MNATTWTLEVSKADLTECRIHRQPSTAIEDGTVRVPVESLAMTANTMTYAALGDEMRYWSLYPSPTEGCGRVPAWGHGRVIASAIEGISVGDRLFGLLPMASQVVLSGRRSRLGQRETSPARSGVNPVYNQYALEALVDQGEREMRAVFQPLFVTSFVLARHLLEVSDAVPPRIVIVSASSKTALGTAFELGAVRDRLIGLTSRRHAAWLRETRVYGTVLGYDELERIADAGPSLVIDFSGDDSLLERVEWLLGPGNTRLLRVGWTHGRSLAAGDTAFAPDARVFFGPTHIERRVAEWGAAEFDRRLQDALKAFSAALRSHFQVDHQDGEKGMVSACRAIQQGNVDAARMLIARPAIE